MQLGILTFLRRSSKHLPPLKHEAADPHPPFGHPLRRAGEGDDRRARHASPLPGAGTPTVDVGPRPPFGPGSPRSGEAAAPLPQSRAAAPGEGQTQASAPIGHDPAESVAAPAEPRPYRSEQYSFGLILPPGWRQAQPPSGFSDPAVERFASADGALKVSLWSEPCSVRALPPVPAAQRAAALPLDGGFVVPFVAYAPTDAAGEQYLEGRWLRGGRRWTCSLQLPAAERAAALRRLRAVLSTLRLDG